MIDLKILEEEAEREVARATEKMKNFLGKFEGFETLQPFAPAHDLGWNTDDAFRAAVRLKVWKWVLEKKGKYVIPDEDVVRYFADRALDHVIHDARWPKCSTNPYANLIAQEETAAWAELYCTITERL